MEEPNFLAGNHSLNFDTVVEAIIKRSCIIDFGIVQGIPSDGLVDVSIAVSTTKQDMFCTTCVLANIASSSFTVNVKPNIGDRVLIVYPRIYDKDMFTVPDSEDDKKKIIVNEKAKGYNLLSGIAILMNQYKEASHKSVLKVEDGVITVTNADKEQSITVDLTQDSKIVISDSNGMNIESTSSSTIINGHLEIKV